MKRLSILAQYATENPWDEWIDPVVALPDSWPANLCALLAATLFDDVAAKLMYELNQEVLILANQQSISRGELPNILQSERAPEIFAKITQKESFSLTAQPILRYWRRIIWMEHNKLLSCEMKERVLLFLQGQLADEAWIEIPGYNAWVPLLFTSSNALDSAWQKYRAVIILKLCNSNDINEIYFLFSLPPDFRSRFITSDDELLHILLKKLKPYMAIVHKRPESDPLGFNRQDSQKWEAIVWLLCFICGPRLVELASEHEWLLEHLQNLYKSCQNADVPHLRLELVMASLCSPQNSANDLLRHIEEALFAGDNTVFEAGITLLTWSKYFQILTPQPPIELLSKAFALRRPFNKQLCKLLVERQKYISTPFSQTELGYILPALAHYANELGYAKDFAMPESFGTLERKKPLRLELPEERWQCAQFIAALCEQNPNVRTFPEVQVWIESMKNDPLAEVRRVEEAMHI